MRLLRLVAALLALQVGLCRADEAQPKNPVAEAEAEVPVVPLPVAIPTPADAVILAVKDLRSLPLGEQPYQRYFLTYDRSKEFRGVFSYVVNSCLSHATTLQVPVVCGDGWLLRVDIRKLWPRKDDFNVLYEEWEKLAAIEPYFHVTGELVIKEGAKAKKIEVPAEPYFITDEKGNKKGPYNTKWIDPPASAGTGKEVVKRGTDHALHLLGEHKEEAAIADLANRTGSLVPIARADWLILTLSTAIENGREHGRYYQFRRISKSKDGKTAEELWLTSIGEDIKTVQNIRTDQRVAKSRSKVTRKPRRIVYFNGSSVRASVGPSLVAITEDYFDGTIKALDHPLKSLLGDTHDGTEAMGFLPNGMMIFVLFDGKGELVELAPQALVADRLTPDPSTTNLQPPISCWRCHAPKDMWLPAPNDIMQLTKRFGGVNIFDDQLSKSEDAIDTVDRLAGLFTGEIEPSLMMARNTHAKASFIATGGMQLPAIGAKISAVVREYFYDPVTPRTACRELGYECAKLTDEEALVFFEQLVPVLPPNRLGVRSESLTGASLRSWEKGGELVVNRTEWEQEYSDFMLRATAASIARQAKEARNKGDQP